MSRLFLVRHGETVWHAENRYAGRSDIALTPRGAQQAERLARWAVSAKLDAVWSSNLQRARNTAHASAVAAGVTLNIEPGLSELDFGRGEGLTGAEMEAAFPAERAAFLNDPAAYPLPGGESPAVAAERGLTAVQNINRKYDARSRVLIVMHSTLIRLVLCRMLGIELSRYRTAFPNLANTALTEIKLTSRDSALLSFNLPLPD